MVASLAACAANEDLKDTRPADTGDLSVSEVALVDSGDASTLAETGESDTAADATIGDVVDSSSSDTGATATDTGTITTETSVTGDSTISDTAGSKDTGSPVDSTVTDSTLMDTAPIDSTVVDSSAVDTRVGSDTSVVDSVVIDTNFDTGTISDTGVPDAADPDTGTVPDTGDPDTGDPDTGTVPDTGDPDTGDPDTGTVDTGDPDTGTVDTGDLADTSVETTTSSLPKASFRTTPAWSHTIGLDGVNDFTKNESFTTTTSGQHAFITWDVDYLYIGYENIAPDESLNIYLSTGATGTLVSDKLAAQQVLLASTADRAVVVRSDGASFLQWSGASWLKMPVAVDVARTARFVEVRIPFAILGTGPRLGVATFVAGDTVHGALFASSWMDGYSPAGAPKTVAHQLNADRTLATPPASVSRLH